MNLNSRSKNDESQADDEWIHKEMVFRCYSYTICFFCLGTLLCIHYSYCYYVSSLKAILLLLLCYDLFYKNQVNQIGSRATPEKQLTK